MNFRGIILIIFHLATLLSMCQCTLKEKLKGKIKDLQEKGEQLYGQLGRKTHDTWQFEVADRLSYPRGDKDKLSEISKMWMEYYECAAKLVDDVRDYGGLPALSMMAYSGAAALLTCNLCVSPEDRSLVTWWYSATIEYIKFQPIAEKETIVKTEDELTIYNAEVEDAGVYSCRVGDSAGGLVLLEVVDHEELYTVVKPSSSNGPFPMPDVQLSSSVALKSVWSPWSRCSRCDRVGRRRRYGPCYIAHHQQKERNISSVEEAVTLSDNSVHMFKVFPYGLPCRSRYLPNYLVHNHEVGRRRSEIMIGLCKVKCQENVIFEVRGSRGQLLESANNSGGVYSLLQRPPRQPPPPNRDIIFATRLQAINITCPGTTLRDIPLTWKIGTLDVVPRDLDRSSGGRMFISARDQLVITTVKYTDANLYSCWQDGILAGSIKLEVWEGRQNHWNHHLTLLAMILIVGVTLRVTLHVWHNKRRKITML